MRRSRIAIIAEKKSKEVVPANEQAEAVSPATRLLEKRRMMYENQEAFKAKKKEFAYEEVQFRA